MTGRQRASGKKNTKRKPWVRRRHRVITALARPIVTRMCKSRYGFRPEPVPNPERQYLILYNHQTPYDQFFVALSFPRPIYYVATEDIFSMGAWSNLLRFAEAPIPIKKSGRDVRAVMHMMQVAKEGGSIAIAPEGNRTYSGRTGHIRDSVVTLVQKLKLPVVFFRIEGGYGAEPRWSDVTRRGRVRGYVSGILEPEQVAALSFEELYRQIREALYVDESLPDGDHGSLRSAEYLERAFYTCPVCGLTTWRSRGERASCETCGLTIRYGADKQITAVSGESVKQSATVSAQREEQSVTASEESAKQPGFPYQNAAEWYEAQEAFVRTLDLTVYQDEAMYTDTARFFRVIPYRRKERIAKKTPVSLFGDRIEIGTGAEGKIVFSFAQIQALSCMGHNKLNIYYHEKASGEGEGAREAGDEIYQIRGDVRFNALKYVNIFYLWKGRNKGGEDAEFLGL